MRVAVKSPQEKRYRPRMEGVVKNKKHLHCQLYFNEKSKPKKSYGDQTVAVARGQGDSSPKGKKEIRNFSSELNKIEITAPGSGCRVCGAKKCQFVGKAKETKARRLDSEGI